MSAARDLCAGLRDHMAAELDYAPSLTLAGRPCRTARAEELSALGITPEAGQVVMVRPDGDRNEYWAVTITVAAERVQPGGAA